MVRFAESDYNASESAAAAGLENGHAGVIEEILQDPNGDVNALLSLVEALQRNYGAPSVGSSSLSSFGVGKYCVIRTYSAGVHLGTVKEREGREMILSGARRLHYWNGAFTLSGVANDGVGDKSRLSDPVKEILLTEVIEVLPCSEKAAQQLKGMRSHEIN